MAELKLNPVFSNVSGRLGNIVIYRWNGKLFTRLYVKPRNPGTKAQMVNRLTFSDAVKRWKELSDGERLYWNRTGEKKKRRGYNLFLSEYMKSKKSFGAAADKPDPEKPSMTGGYPVYSRNEPVLSESFMSGQPLRCFRPSAPLVAADCFRIMPEDVLNPTPPAS